MIDTNELRRLTQEATPGPWMIDYVGVGFEVAAGESVIAQSQQIQGDMRHKARKANAAFIAAANPAAISELLDRLEAAEKERDAAELMSLALRAKIAEMEQQSPICRIKDIRRAHYMTKVVGLDPEAWLYALPGAKGEEK